MKKLPFSLPGLIALALALGSPEVATADPSGAGVGTPVAELRVITRTGANLNDDTDDAFEFCVSADRCWNLDNGEINDRERGRVDEVSIEATPLDLEDIEQVTLRPRAGSGSDAWRPSCLAVIADGTLLYCKDDIEVQLGSDPQDEPEWTDANPSFQGCAGCYGSALTHGPLVGHTTPTSARIWVRIASSLSVQVRYGLEADLSGAVTSATVTPSAGDDFTGTIDLAPLLADTTYHYEVLVDGLVASSPGLSFATAPAGPAAFTAAFGSCAKESEFPVQPIFDTIRASHAPALMLMLGDNHYANTTDPARLDFFYRNSRSVASLADLVARTPTWAVWDDHDFTGNNTNGTAVDKERSLAAFERHWGNGSHGQEGADGIWSRFGWGAVEFFLLDDRYHRDPPATPDGTMLGATQLAWLLDGLVNSTAVFKVLVSGSQWTPSGSEDSWASFDAERELILDHVMQEGVSGVLLISGDVHRAEVRRLRDASPTSYAIWEFTSSPLANSFSTCPTGPMPDTLVFCTDTSRNFGLLRFDTAATQPSLTFEVRRGTDTLLHSTTLTLDDLTLPIFEDGFETGDASAWSEGPEGSRG